MNYSGSASPVLGIVLVVVYFIPAIVAVLGRHRRWLLITLIDVMFGWTVIGWFIALGLLATARRQQPPPPPPDAGQGGLPTPSAPPPPPAPAPTESRVDQLERLAVLHESGALTDEEFAAEKAKLLGAP
jgi:hypothetical protein